MATPYGPCQPFTRVNQTIVPLMDSMYSKRDETGDVAFIVESQSIRAHRNVLAAISPKYGTQPDTGDIRVENVSAAAFNEFLQFFYLSKVNLTKENIEDVLDLAKQSLVDAFVEECINFLMNVALDNLCWVYRIAIFHDIDILEEYCEQRISLNAKKLFASDEFINCDHDLVMEILEIDTLCCKEVEIFEARIIWAKASANSKGINAENMEHLRAELGDFLTQIRFSSMSIEEFVKIHNKYKELFNENEFTEIIYIIGKLEGFKSQRFNQTPRVPRHSISETMEIS